MPNNKGQLLGEWKKRTAGPTSHKMTFQNQTFLYYPIDKHKDTYPARKDCEEAIDKLIRALLLNKCYNGTGLEVHATWVVRVYQTSQEQNLYNFIGLLDCTLLYCVNLASRYLHCHTQWYLRQWLQIIKKIKKILTKSELQWVWVSDTQV